MRNYLYGFGSRSAGERKTSGIAYVIIPQNIDRTIYIKNCLLKSRLTLLLDSGGYIEDVLVLKHVFNDLRWPAKFDELGSQVFWTKITDSNHIIVQGIILKDDEILNQNEEQWAFSKSINGKFVEVAGDAKNAKININVHGEESNQGELIINVANKDSTAKLKITIKGSIIIDTDKNIEVIGAKNTVTLTDSGINIDSGENNVFINGNKQVLYCKIPGAESIEDVSEIGVSEKVKVG